MHKYLCLLILTLGLSHISAAEPEKATFAVGCFWCVEGIYESVPGVLDAVSGFSGGKIENPTYESHGDHTETVDVTFDPDKESYEQLLRLFWKSRDITDPRGVAPDFGPSYGPGLLYRTPTQLATIERVKAELQKDMAKQITTEVVPFEKFWQASDYHQNFVRLHPDQNYVRAVSLPRIRETLGQ